MKRRPDKLSSDDAGAPFIEYMPPKAELVRSFAHSVCEALAAQTHDQAFTQPHVIRGLTQFLELAARVQAKHFNEEQGVDNHEE